jgi:hypothetical protein
MAEKKMTLTAVINGNTQGLVNSLRKASGAIGDNTKDWKDRLEDFGASMKLAEAEATELAQELNNLDFSGISGEELNALISNAELSKEAMTELASSLDGAIAGLQEMQNSASSLGMGMQEFQAFSQSASEAGISIGDASAAMNEMQSQITAFLDGGEEAKRVFEDLGLSIEQMSSGSTMDKFSRISEAINAQTDETKKAEAQQKIFNLTLDQTNRLAEKYKEIAKRKGRFADEKTLANAIKYRQELKNVERNLQNIGNAGTTSTDKIEKGWNKVADAIKNAWNWLTKYKSKQDEATDGAKFGKVAQGWQQLGGSLLHAGSAIAIIAKGIQAVGQIIEKTIIQPIRDAYDLKWENLQEGKDSRITAMEKELQSYNKQDAAFRDLYRKLQDYKNNPTAEAEVKVAQAKRDYIRDYRLDDEEVAIVLKPDISAEELADALDDLHKRQLDNLKSQEKELAKVDNLLKAEIEDTLKRDAELQRGGMARGLIEQLHAEKQINARIEEQKKNFEDLSKIRERIAELQKRSSVGADFLQLEKARQLDADKAKRKGEIDSRKKLNEDLRNWQSELTDDEIAKRRKAIEEKYHALLKRGADRATARNLRDKALAKIDEEIRQKRIDEFEKALQAFRDAQDREREANRKVIDARNALARVQVAQAQEAKEDIRERRRERRRSRIDKRLATFGFDVDKADVHLSAKERRRNRRNARLDASISDKLARQEAGERIHFTPAEKRRINSQLKLKDNLKAMDNADKQKEAADRQLDAASALQDASSALKRALGVQAEKRQETRKAKGEAGRKANGIKDTGRSMATAYKSDLAKIASWLEKIAKDTVRVK